MKTEARSQASTSVGVSEKVQGLNINFRLIPAYSQKLERMALASRLSPNQMARQLLVSTIENPDKAEFLNDLYELGTNSEFILNQMQELRREIASLKVVMAASTELFLTIAVGIEPEDARTVIDEFFNEEEA